MTDSKICVATRTSMPGAVASRPSLVTLPLHDASARDGELAQSLTGLLQRELVAAGRFEAVSGLAVARAQMSLDNPPGEPLLGAELERLRAQLAVDLVVSGSCRRIEDPEGTALLLVARVQDARSGALVAHVHVLGPDDAAGVARSVADAVCKQLGLASAPPRLPARGPRHPVHAAAGEASIAAM